MANYCCVCGAKIGLLDSYKNIRKTGELVCMQCEALLKPYSDRMWRAANGEDTDTIYKEAIDDFRSKASFTGNVDKLLMLWEEKHTERLAYLTKDYSSIPAAVTPPPSPYDELRKKLILSTASVLQGYRITKQLGVVFGETVFKPSAGQQFASSLGDTFRALSFTAKEMSGQVAIIEEARQFAYTKMMKEALDLGANAIIGIDSDNTIGDNICYLSLYGTAVYAEPEE